jgi:hypothetical protein
MKQIFFKKKKEKEKEKKGPSECIHDRFFWRNVWFHSFAHLLNLRGGHPQTPTHPMDRD